MKIAKPYATTANKYRLHLKSLLFKLQKHNFDKRDFVDHSNLPNGFIYFCIKLGYIRKDGKILMPNLYYDEVTMYDGWNLAKAILEYNMAHSTYYQKGDYVVPSIESLMNGITTCINSADIQPSPAKQKRRKNIVLNLFGWKITLVKR